MNKVFSALAVSVDGYITGRDPGPDRGLGDGGMLFDWYFDGDVPSQVFDSFRLSEPSARFFDAMAGRVGASIAGRNTYEDSNRFGDDGTPHPAAPLFVLSHRPAPQMAGRQTLITTGLEGRHRGRPGRSRRQRRRPHGRSPRDRSPARRGWSTS